MVHAQKPDSVFQRNGRVHLYWRGCQFSRVLAFLECGSGENDCSNTGWTVPSQAEDCWLPTPFTSFPFTSPPVRRRVPSDSVSNLQTALDLCAVINIVLNFSCCPEKFCIQQRGSVVYNKPTVAVSFASS